ncbi:MAG: energy-coupling factor transporter ATPase [Clostridia bacterium]|nr:energy-coupling factor transporter ATPase [Clostridia bacterium]
MEELTAKVENGGDNVTEGATAALPDFAVKMDNVGFSYADGQPNAVNNVTLEVKRGEFLAVLGHNGSGKSTLARLICGLLTADTGSISVWGYNPADKEQLGEVRAHAGVVFQNPDNQMVASIVEDDIAFGPENLGVPREEIGERISWALAAVGMEEFRHSTPTRLSGGQKQRIAVAGVLAIKPDVLILDESTAMLDPRGRREVTEVAARLNREEGMTVILITHFMEEALLADRAVIMNRGEIVACGTPQEIFERGEQLETYNLCLPEIGEICNKIKAADIDIPTCLRPAELAAELKKQADIRGFNPRQSARTDDAPDENQAREWDIDISNLTFTYSAKSPFATQALKGVNLHISEGEFFGIIGHTGSGKSTLVQHLNALIKLPQAQKHYKKPRVKKGQTPPPQSSLVIGKYDLSKRKCDWRNLRADVGMVFQYPEYQLFAETVFADVAFGLKNFRPGLSKEEVQQAVKESLEAVGLNYDEVQDKSPFDLSGGQKRRAAIAGVIVTKPKILVLDEPAAGLDPLGKREIMKLLHSLHGDWCKTVIIVSHDMDEIAENCTRACVVSNGQIVACDKPEGLFKRAEELQSLGLDVPVTAKICTELSALGLDLECDFTSRDFAAAVISALGGGGNA